MESAEYVKIYEDRIEVLKGKIKECETNSKHIKQVIEFEISPKKKYELRNEYNMYDIRINEYMIEIQKLQSEIENLKSHDEYMKEKALRLCGATINCSLCSLLDKCNDISYECPCISHLKPKPTKVISLDVLDSEDEYEEYKRIRRLTKYDNSSNEEE